MKIHPPRSTAPHAGDVTRIGRESDGTVQSLSRALALLEVLAEDDDGYRLVDLAERTGLSTRMTER